MDNTRATTVLATRGKMTNKERQREWLRKGLLGAAVALAIIGLIVVVTVRQHHSNPIVNDADAVSVDTIRVYGENNETAVMANIAYALKEGRTSILLLGENKSSCEQIVERLQHIPVGTWNIIRFEPSRPSSLMHEVIHSGALPRCTVYVAKPIPTTKGTSRLQLVCKDPETCVIGIDTL